MKRFLTLAISILFVFTMLIPTNSAFALSGGTWASGIKIQNLDPLNTALVTLDLKDPDGIDVAMIGDVTPLEIPVGSAIEIYLPNYSNVDSGQYSAVINSTTQVGAVVTNTNYAYGLADSYNSMEPASKVMIPYVYHNHNNWSTEIYVQNTQDVAVEGTITLSEPVGGTSSTDGLGDMVIDFSIPAAGVYVLDSAAYEDLGWFIGSGVVEVTSPLDGTVTVVANQMRLVGEGDFKGNVLIQNRGLVAGDSGSTIVLPSLYKEFSGVSGTWRSGIKIQNPGTTPVDVVVTFNADPGSASGSFTGTKTITGLAAGANAELYLANLILDDASSLPNMFLGSAEISVTGGEVVSSVQHTNYDAGSGYGVGLGYTGFSISNGSGKVILPSLYNWPSGTGIWVSGIKIQNFGTAPVDIEVILKADPDVATWTKTISGITIDPGKSTEVYLGNPVFEIPSTWKGSAVITTESTENSLIVATVLHTNYGRHVATMYTGIPELEIKD